MLKQWLLQGMPEETGFYEREAQASQETRAWWQVMCLTGVDYFSTLNYSAGIAALAAGALSPIATLILVLVTLFGALPMYRMVASRSPHGDGSLSMLEHLLSYWPSKLLILSLLGFVATGFIITITLSAADAGAHMVENSYLHTILHGHQMLISMVLILALTVVFLRGFGEAIGIAVGLVTLYIGLSLVVIGRAGWQVIHHTEVLTRWHTMLYAHHASAGGIVVAALLIFPALALGLSGFETGVVVMPLVRGAKNDDVQLPAARIRNAKKLLTVAALIMSVMLLASSLVTTWLIPPQAFQAGGPANGRAMAYLAHSLLGNEFGTAYDISAIAILWFAGASAMAGLLNITPRYLPRYGMAPNWARAQRPLILVFSLVALAVTVFFRANVEAQAGAYATGVLALMTSAAIAVTLACWRDDKRGLALFFGSVTSVFIYVSVDTLLRSIEGLVVALFFILAILIISLVSRISRSLELRVQQVTFDEKAQELLAEVLLPNAPVRFIANKRQAGDDDEYRLKNLDVRMDNHLEASEVAVFLEVLITDASEFGGVVRVEGMRIGPHRVFRACGPSIPNVLAAVLLSVSEQDDMPSHIYFEWSERSPGTNALRFLFAGEGDVPALTHEILRKAIPDERRRPQCHVGG